MVAVSTRVVEAFGLGDLRMSSLADFDLQANPFWTSFALTLLVYPLLFYLTWYLNPSLTKNRLGLSWVLSLFSATMFTVSAFYEIPHVRTLWDCAVDYASPMPGSPEMAALSEHHAAYQAQMQRPHLLFSLENYPDPSRIGPYVIAANFQAFLVLDLVFGVIYYREQMGPFSTWFHHIVYYFIVVHMKSRGLLDVFCALGTPIELSSVFLSWGYMFPHQRNFANQLGYVTSFVCNRLFYVAIMWHEVYFNLEDKSVRYLYTLTLLFHIYWFGAYIQNQRRYGRKKRRLHFATVLQGVALRIKAEKEGNKALDARAALKDSTTIFKDNKERAIYSTAVDISDDNTDPYTTAMRDPSNTRDPLIAPIPQPRSRRRV
ncbi:hypothetical protein BGZ73_006694 [Actinomortierella ambigua]|nr:hypothetical protein BGZ73_006694 [Actinomortierella ambigua]